MSATSSEVVGVRASSSMRGYALTGLGLAALGAVAASAKAIVVKLAYRHGIDATSLLALRMLFAFPFFLVMGWWAARRAHSTLSLRDWGHIAGLGFVGYYLSSYLDFLGLTYISATLERLILYLGPTLVMLINLVMTGRRPSRLQLVALVVSYFGVLLVFAHDIAWLGRDTLIGSALVFGCALSYAIYLFGSGQVVARIGALRLTAYASGVACVLCIGQFWVAREATSLLSFSAPVYWLSLINGSVCTVVPVLAIMIGVKRIGSSLASQVALLGPVSTIVLSVWLLGEPMGGWQCLGTALVLGGVLFVGRDVARP